MGALLGGSAGVLWPTLILLAAFVIFFGLIADAGKGPSALWAPWSKRLLTPWSLSIGLTALFFLLVALVYHYTSPYMTGYNEPVRVADAFLRGRLDIANGGVFNYLQLTPFEGKYYWVEPPMAAIVLLPVVLVFGVGLNQALVSVVIGGITASSIFWLMRGLTDKLSVQVWLTLLFVFGTIFWWNAANGAGSEFNQTLAALFVFLAIYETLVSKRPFLAGLFLGAAFGTRLPVILSLPFFVIMFSDQWLPQSSEKSLLRRIDIKPLVWLGSGLGILLALHFAYNYLTFDTPLPAAAYSYLDTYPPTPWTIPHGIFDIRYIPVHLPVFFKSLAIFQSEPPYVLPSWSGMAIWVTTPPFLYALFAGIRNKLVIVAGAALLVVSLAFFVLTARGLAFLKDGLDAPFGLEYYPILLLIGYGLFVAIRDGNRLVIACWAAIIPIALLHFSYFTTPPQFGYRYPVDYYPFLFLLTWVAIGDKIRWHHMILIALAIIVNLWGVLWTYRFSHDGFLGLQWVGW